MIPFAPLNRRVLLFFKKSRIYWNYTNHNWFCSSRVNLRVQWRTAKAHPLLRHARLYHTTQKRKSHFWITNSTFQFWKKLMKILDYFKLLWNLIWRFIWRLILRQSGISIFFRLEMALEQKYCSFQFRNPYKKMYFSKIVVLF